MALTVSFVGLSGTKYDFYAYSVGQEFLAVSGVYAFCKASLFSTEALYVGQTESFFNRLNAGLDHHDGFKCARARGVTHIAVRPVADDAERARVELDLIHGLRPVCNRQHVSPATRLLTR